MCDDLTATIQTLKAAGAEVSDDVSDRRYGLVTSIRLPGGDELGLYQPHHPVAHNL